jgi:MFS family permease
MVIFLGFVCGGLFVVPLSDVLGRKKIFIVSLIGIFILNWMLLYQKDYHDLQYSLFSYGILLITATISGILMMTQMVDR